MNQNRFPFIFILNKIGSCWIFFFLTERKSILLSKRKESCHYKRQQESWWKTPGQLKCWKKERKIFNIQVSCEVWVSNEFQDSQNTSNKAAWKRFKVRLHWDFLVRDLWLWLKNFNCILVNWDSNHVACETIDVNIFEHLLNKWLLKFYFDVINSICTVVRNLR